VIPPDVDKAACDVMPWREMTSSVAYYSPLTMRSIFITLLFAHPLVAAPDFEREVAPILEGRCLSCHDAASNKGKVRLDTREHLLPHITVGKPEASSLIEQVSGPEPEMPKKADPLSAAQVETLRQWITAGAPWPTDRVLKDDPPRDLNWWSLREIRNPKSEARTTVDDFIEAKLVEKGLKPVAAATAETLRRRLSYDLTGLPPTAHKGEIEVDQLLASPAFGEKFAQHWLDLVRYAETHGYDKDKPRNNAWPYRDYVIRSLNEDKPFDRFVQEQIAGDALFPGEEDGILGLGFIAAGPWDYIGHSEVGEAKEDGRIAKHLDRDEMVSAVFNIFTSTTVQCAQCHHHKFDPVKMEDYYRLHAVFAAVDRADRVYSGLPPEKEKQRNQLLAQINALKAEQNKLTTAAKQTLGARTSGIERRLNELRQKHGSPLRPQYGWHSTISAKQDAVKWVQLDLGKPNGIEQARLIPAYDDYNQIGAGFGFPVRYKVEVSNDAEFKTGVRLVLDATKADQPNPRNGEIVIDVGREAVRFLRVTATKLAPRKDDFIFALGELQAIGGENHDNLAIGAVITAQDSIESAPRWSRTNLTDGIFHREVGDPAALEELLDLERQKLAIEKELADPKRDARLKEIETTLADLNPKLAAFPKGELVYAAATDFTSQGRFIATASKARPIALLHRGDIRAPGELMRPGLAPLWPSAKETLPLPETAPESAARSELAKAITARDNPLFWRSIVNRLWQWTMGQPLVGTPNDFGRMGMTPSHPELLDFLAATLRDDPKHSLKNIVRLIVSSHAYRRASTHDEANATIDAGNTYLWRANRRRLTAEEFRDSTLAAAGVLRLEERGGPSFQDFVIEKPQHSPHYQYHLHDPLDPKGHRRSVYRFIVRSQPQPFLTSLDCADPSQSVPQRDESTTALQALTQWNNRLVEAMAEKVAERFQGEPDPVKAAFSQVLARPPTEPEQMVLTEHLKQHGPAALARVLFNLNAFVYVD
jgi:hypothetical protein